MLITSTTFDQSDVLKSKKSLRDQAGSILESWAFHRWRRTCIQLAELLASTLQTRQVAPATKSSNVFQVTDD